MLTVGPAIVLVNGDLAVKLALLCGLPWVAVVHSVDWYRIRLAWRYLALDIARQRPAGTAAVTGPELRRRVARALRAGHAEDPLVDALVREHAEQFRRQRSHLWTFGFFLLLYGIGLLATFFAASSTPLEVTASGLGAVGFAALLGYWVRERQRIRRYLANRPSAGQDRTDRFPA